MPYTAHEGSIGGEVDGPSELGFPAALMDGGSYDGQVVSFIASIKGHQLWVLVTGQHLDYGQQVELPSPDYSVRGSLDNIVTGNIEDLVLQEGVLSLQGTIDNSDKTAKLVLALPSGQLIHVDGYESVRSHPSTICLGS